MEKQLVTPDFPLSASLPLFVIVLLELILYGAYAGVPLLWVSLVFGAFYLGYIAIFRHDALPLIFAILFLTAYHSLFYHYKRDLPIALLFMIIFIVNSAIMWLLLSYATHLRQEYQIAYSFISGFMIAQILTLFGSMARDWPFRFELASYFPTVFSYIFWRFACLSAEAMLTWRQFIRVAVVVVILLIAIIIGSPNLPV